MNLTGVCSSCAFLIHKWMVFKPSLKVQARFMVAGECGSTFTGDKGKHADKVYLDFGDRDSDFDGSGRLQHEIRFF